MCVVRSTTAVCAALSFVGSGPSLSPRISPASNLTIPLAFPIFHAIPHALAPRCQQQRASPSPRSAVPLVLPPTHPIPPLAGPGLFDAWRPACVVLCAYLCGGRSRDRNHKTTKPQNRRTAEPKNQKTKKTPAADVLSSALGYVTNPASPLRSSALSPALRLVCCLSLPHLSLLSILSTLIPSAIPTLLLLCPLCCVLLHKLYFYLSSSFSNRRTSPHPSPYMSFLFPSFINSPNISSTSIPPPLFFSFYKHKHLEHNLDIARSLDISTSHQPRRQASSLDIHQHLLTRSKVPSHSLQQRPIVVGADVLNPLTH